MTPVYLCGRGLACALGRDLAQSLAGLRAGQVVTQARSLRGAGAASFPYFAIPFAQDDWNTRARTLVRQVAFEAGAQPASGAALFIATSSFEMGLVEQGVPQSDYQAFAAKVAGWLDWTGPVYVISTACTSSLNALIAAQALLTAGGMDQALVLGFELDNLISLGGFASLQLLSPTTSKPFGARRDGLVLGEAVAALRLSTSEVAPWKMLGGANVVNGSQPTAACPGTVARMVAQALAASALASGAVDLVKVQAAGSPGNDASEAQGLRAAFATVPPLVSLKAAIGHTMGASGAAEIALLMACLENAVWPGYPDRVDEALGVRLAAQMPDKVRRLMATILGFGGSHATVVLERA